MGIGYVLYNPKAGVDNNIDEIKLLEVVMKEELKFINILNVNDYRVFLTGLAPDDFLILVGGDGTLNRFVNDTEGIDFDNEVLYFPNGTGNDFAHELGYQPGCTPFPITGYLKDLPCVVVNDKKYRFINGVGYGIDGYCCEVGDKLKKIPGKKVNYTTIAIKGLLFHYKPTNAKVTVDGKTHTYKKVWITPTMNGKFYGGGMMPTPNQDRKNKEKTLSVMVLHGSGKLKTLCVFPSIFNGKHIKHTEMVEVLTGHEITVEYDRPTALQIDGETILGVTSYTAFSPIMAKAKQTETTFYRPRCQARDESVIKKLSRSSGMRTHS